VKRKPERTLHDIPTVSAALDDGRLIELVLDEETGRTMFAVGRGEAVELVRFINNGDARLIPIPERNNLIRHGAVVLSGPPSFEADGSDLLQTIEEHIARYVAFSDRFRKVAAAYVLLTWVYDAFNELPYLRLRGDYGTGKTRALIVIGSLCYKAFFASGASTVSPIFHTLDTFRGTLILDEADFRFSDEKAELVKILNNGNARGFPVLRTSVSPTREFDPRAFHVFGPKIVAMRRSFDDRGLESRFLTEDMVTSESADIPISLPSSHAQQASILRSQLLAYRFRTLHRTGLNESMIDPDLSPRFNQILTPLVSIVDDDDLRGELRRKLRSFEAELEAERAASPEACVLEVLACLLENMNSPTIPISEVTAAFIDRFQDDFERPITGRYIGRILRERLRISTYRTHGVFVIPVTERAKIDQLCARYGIRRDN
jgi:hypothetical protein